MLQPLLIKSFPNNPPENKFVTPEGRNEMKKRTALLPLGILITVYFVLLGTTLMVRAEDMHSPQSVHRLEYVHFDSVAQTVEWGVSEGSFNDAGVYVPNDSPLATYSMNLATGVMTHAGEDGQLSHTDAVDAFRVFQALSQMMRGYTDHWNEPDAPVVQNYQGDDSEQEDEPRLLYINSPCSMGVRSPAPGNPRHENRFAGKGDGSMTSVFLNRLSVCSWPVSGPGFMRASAAIGGDDPASSPLAKPGSMVLASRIFSESGGLPEQALITG